MRICPHNELNCYDPLCLEGKCIREKQPSEKTWEELMEKVRSTPYQFHSGPQPIHIHVHYDNSEIRELLLQIQQTLKHMPTKADFDAFVAQINQSTNDLGSSLDNIATDITTLTDKLVTGGLTPDETTAVLAEFSGVADKVKSLADAAKSIADRTPE